MTLRYALSLFFAPGALAALAQPTLTEADNVPLAGQTFDVWSADAFIGPGGAGVNQDYDYWNILLPSTGNHPEYYLNPAVTPTSAQIPTAELLSTDGGSDTLFWATTLNGFEQVGERTSLPVPTTINYTDPILELKLPCTYLDSWSDGSAANYTISGFPVARVGNITGVADAYGTLEMPWELVYPEVLRVKVRRAITDNSLAVITRISNTYYYYAPALRFPVVKLVQDSTQLGVGATWAITYRATWTGNPVVVGTHDISPDAFAFNAYPNPASDLITLSTEAVVSKNCIAEVTSATGQVVMTQRISGEQNSMDVRALSPGVYQLRLVSNEGVLGTQRLVIR